MAKPTHTRVHREHLLLGAHTSIAGGLQNALYEGASIGCTCIQMFTHSNRQWGMPPLSEESARSFEEARKATKINDIMVHASYLINIAAADNLVYKKSVTALEDELRRCEALAIPLLVLHPGSSVGQPPEKARDQIVATITDIFSRVPYKYTTLLLENMAGQGSLVGATLEEIAYLCHHIKPRKRIGVCIDTCHAFAAGYAIDTPRGYEEFWQKFDTLLGLSHLKALHLNDSMGSRGSRKDRHAHIGQGQLGLATFKRIMLDARFKDIPKVIETPREDISDHAHNIKVLESLLK